ncbi:hypothetical protein [Mycobacterium sp. 852002-51057_SCH5723018]|uniref:hypothetical protein n=1 Tax=Mycobacterium sp. 852002-51057_SCH5723018 TaxID=1834094 RepID=UPI0007FEF816|nr:hypothetical protein [Mycobacterium sp. 852002-51057_SCH5723018]OBG27888.1 hypothetical protein A5764_02730 [Mycobacterium sp. 852002-51057_SCH5723018]
MVQVDVFWSYAIGAGFAMAATRQIARAGRTEPASGPVPNRWRRFSSPHRSVTLLYCAVLFAASGIYLLWAFPDWETMQVATDHASIPAWLVTIFAITNVTQGLLGYWVAERLILAGHHYAAFLQVCLGYFAMFFILVHGWDGRGYQRFFSADKETFQSWPADPSLVEALGRIGRWLTSPVALTLAAMTVIVIVLLWIMLDSMREGYRSAGVDEPRTLVLLAAMLTTVFGVCVLSAILASALVHLMGWFIGIPLAAVAIWIGAVWPRTGVVYRLYGLLRLVDARPALAQPVAATT